MPGPVRNPTEAYQQLEAIMLRQMLQSSGAFRAGSTPGAQLRTDLFVETLADAVAKAGGLGIARMLERQLGGTEPRPVAGKPMTLLHAAGNRTGTTIGAGVPGVAAAGGPPGGSIDDLDDPNSEAPLPEDPSAPSIDDYQARPMGQTHAVERGQPMAIGRSAGAEATSHPHIQTPMYDHPIDGTSGSVPISITRALNRYRGRVEDMGAGTPLGTGSREKP